MKLEVINCKHWSGCKENSTGGCCALNLPEIGPMPGYGICKHACTKREPITSDVPEPTPAAKPTPQRRTAIQKAKRIAHGAAGLTKWALGIGTTPDDILSKRLEICNACPKKTKAIGGITTKCSVCGCILPAKQKNYGERCPIGLWDNIDRNENNEVILKAPIEYPDA
jgi:hypothetical protein